MTTRVTPGRRVITLVSDSTSHALVAGDYHKVSDTRYVVKSPDGELGIVTSPPWTITEHADGTITVRASIWFNKPFGWHGFLTKGQWEQCDDRIIRAKLQAQATQVQKSSPPPVKD